MIVAPRIAPFSFEETPLHSGQYAFIQCVVPDGDLPIDINWQFNGRNIDEFPDIVVAKAGRRGSTLTIESITYSLAGNYSCHAKNKAGLFVYTAQLQVNGY